MENQSETENDERELYLYLDFGGKFTREMLQQPVFLHLANLHKSHPLVQLNENVYKGTYDFALGTNLFFGMTENEPNTDYFQRKSGISLDHVLNETKVLNLQLVKVRPKVADIPKAPQKIHYNFQWDYNTLLEKFENGTLDLKDFTTENKVPAVPVTEDNPVKTENLERHEDTMEDLSEDHSNSNEDKYESKSVEEELTSALESSYIRLQNLARRPTRRKVVHEVVEECDPMFKEAYEYHNIERQVLRPCDYFFTEKVETIDESTLSDCVDINRCVLYGILKPSKDFPRILTPEEKRAVLTLDNFDNLSLAARYSVLCDQVKMLENIVSKLTSSTKDETGRTPQQTLTIYKKLKDAVAKRICDIKASLED